MFHRLMQNSYNEIFCMKIDWEILKEKDVGTNFRARKFEKDS